MSNIPKKFSPHEVVLAQHSITGVKQWYTEDGWANVPDEVSPAGTIKKQGWVQISEKEAPKPPEIGGKKEDEDNSAEDAKAIKAAKEDKSRLNGDELTALINRAYPGIDTAGLRKSELIEIIKNDGVKEN